MHATRARPTERYAVERTLGRGGMATVYLARDLLLERPVALKVLAPQFADDAPVRERFLREARLVASLAHPSIVAVYDVDEDERGPFIVMEYVEGATLADELVRVGRFDPAEATAIAVELCAALEAAHAAGLVHRDITPRNILRRPDRRVKLADFGIARSVAEPRHTELGTVLGTVAYLAPEQARGDTVTRAADIYSLGVVLYELVTGRRPFAAKTIPGLMLERERGVIVPAADLVPGIPAALEALLMRCLAADPEYRPSSAAALASELTRALDDPVTAPLPAACGGRAVAVTAATGGNSRRRRWFARAQLAVAALVLAVVVATAVGGAAPAWVSSNRSAVSHTPPRAPSTHAVRTRTRSRAAVNPTPLGEIAVERIAINRAVADGELDPTAAAELNQVLDLVAQALANGAAQPAASQLAALGGQLPPLVGSGRLGASALAALEAPLIRMAALLPPVAPATPAQAPASPALPGRHGDSGFGPPGHAGHHGHGYGDGNGDGNGNGFGDGNGNGNGNGND
jgi:serine/threonine-protein kinase